MVATTSILEAAVTIVGGVFLVLCFITFVSDCFSRYHSNFYFQRTTRKSPGERLFYGVLGLIYCAMALGVVFAVIQKIR
jgi:hypothetical protein